jgi:hypothetical protein
MSNALEGNRPTYDGNMRVLFVPQGIVDWDTMFKHGVNLIGQGYTVQMHEHRFTERCSANGVARCGRLTAAETGAILVPDSNGDSPAPRAAN